MIDLHILGVRISNDWSIRLDVTHDIVSYSIISNDITLRAGVSLLERGVSLKDTLDSWDVRLSNDLARLLLDSSESI